MKRSFSILALLSVAALLLWPQTVVVVKKKATASACPSGTYIMAWDGDYTSDTDKACIGSTPTDGTVSGGTLSTDYGESGTIGFGEAGADHYVTWAIADGDLPEQSGAFTVYLRIRVGSDGTDAGTIIWEAEDDTDNVDQAYVTVTDDERIRLSWRGNSTATQIQSAASAISRDGSTWYTVGVSIQPGESTAANDSAVTVDAGSNWTEESDNPPAMTVHINNLTLGNYRVFSGNDPISIDKWVLLDGYKAACPW